MSTTGVAASTADLQFATWGIAAVYADPYAEAPLACRTILTVPQVVDDFGGGRVVRDRRMVKVLASEVAEPHESGVFTIGAFHWRVSAAPRREDALGLIWTCEVVPAKEPLP
jgi:hypothetical protein